MARRDFGTVLRQAGIRPRDAGANQLMRARRAARSGRSFAQQRQAEQRREKRRERQELLAQASKAAEAAGDPSIRDRVEVREKTTTRRDRTSDKLVKDTEQEVLLDGKELSKTPRGAKVAAGDVGTQILMTEAQRRGLKGRKALGAAHAAARRGGLKGFESDVSLAQAEIGGIPLGLIAVGTLVAGGLAAGAGTAGTQAAGTAAPTAGGAGFIGPANVKGLTPIAAGGATGPTAGGGGFIGPVQKGIAVSPSAPGTLAPSAAGRGAVQAVAQKGISVPSGGSAAVETARKAFRGAQLARSIVGGGSRGGRTQTTGEGMGTQPAPQVFILGQQAQPTIQRRQTTTVAGAQPAGLRNLRDKFGGTATASLFSQRKERFGTRTRSSVLGGNR